MNESQNHYKLLVQLFMFATKNLELLFRVPFQATFRKLSGTHFTNQLGNSRHRQGHQIICFAFGNSMCEEAVFDVQCFFPVSSNMHPELGLHPVAIMIPQQFRWKPFTSSPISLSSAYSSSKLAGPHRKWREQNSFHSDVTGGSDEWSLSLRLSGTQSGTQNVIGCWSQRREDRAVQVSTQESVSHLEQQRIIQRFFSTWVLSSIWFQTTNALNLPTIGRSSNVWSFLFPRINSLKVTVF